MRAAVCREYGPPEVVRVEDLPPTPLGPGQVRAGVRAAAVNYPDVLLVAGEYQVKLPVPFVPGSEYAGIVTEVAGDVARSRMGDRVFGTAMAGAFGTEIVVAAQTGRVMPAGLDDRVAAAFGVAHRTAYHVLRSVACLASGEELVVLGAGGGVGLAAVQIGALMGATVTAVASSAAKLDAAAASGARHLVDHTAGDLREALRRVLPGGADEEELIGLLAGGYVTPRIGAVFALEQAAAALRYVADGRTVGKVVLDVSASQWPDRAGTTAST